MWTRIFRYAAPYLPAALSGLLVVFSFPRFDLAFFAWVALVPLLLSIWEQKPGKAFLSGAVFGLVSFFGSLYWIYHSIHYYGSLSIVTSVIVVLALCAYLALYPAVFAWLLSLSFRRSFLPVSIGAPVFWVVLEFLRSYALTGFPWLSIGYSQYRLLPIIQIADITGVYGVSFLVVCVNGAITDLLLLRKRERLIPLFPHSYTVAGFTLLGLLLIFSVGYGAWRLSESRPGSVLRAALVQGNIEQDKKWEPRYQKNVLDTYRSLTESALASSPQLIIWPETALPFYPEKDRELTAELVAQQKVSGGFLVTGAVHFRAADGPSSGPTNSLLLLDAEGKTVYRYDKIHLVPFGEFVPLRRILFFVDKLVVGVGDYVPGTSTMRAETPMGSFAPLICYEVIFPGLVRKFFRDGGGFIVNITNDAWFGKTPGPYQHFSMAVFRAIENRKPLLRSANTGISGVIDSNGRILATTPLFEKTVLLHAVAVDRTKTLYTLYGDIFSYICFVSAILLVANLKSRR